MAAELVTMTDEISGLPLPIAPKCETLKRFDSMIADDHHGWHPRSAPELATLGGQALRSSWMQFVEKDLHNEGPFAYHRFFKGPEIPTDDYDIFGRCVLACAGYIPEQVIDLTTGQPFYRQATQKEMRFLRARDPSNEFGRRYVRYGYDPVRRFFREHTLKQDLSNVRPSTIDEFLHTTNGDRRLQLGNHLLWMASEMAAEKVEHKYQDLRRLGLLHPLMPKDAKPLVKWKLGSKERVQDEVLPVLVQKLEAA